MNTLSNVSYLLLQFFFSGADDKTAFNPPQGLGDINLMDGRQAGGRNCIHYTLSCHHQRAESLCRSSYIPRQDSSAYIYKNAYNGL